MKLEKTYEFLEHIVNTIDETVHPEIYQVIFDAINLDEKIVYDDPMDIAIRLHDADSSLPFPDYVLEFLMEVYEEELSQNNPDAALNLGSLYYTGRAGQQNFIKALEYYTLASDWGSRQAQENLGYCYYYGRGTDVDYKKAFHYFALGAFDGHITSLFKIGDMYRNGYYVERNEDEAFRIYSHCYEELANESFYFAGAEVMVRMADCHYRGIGTNIDYKKALFFYQQTEFFSLDRLENGDYFVKEIYEKSIRRQADVREKLIKRLPTFEWTE